MKSNRLDRLIAYRERIERQKRKEMAEATAILAKKRSDQERWDAEVRREETRLGRVAGTSVTSEELLQQHNYLFHLTSQLRHSNEEVREAERRVHERRESLLGAHRETRALQVLKERHRRAEAQREARRERANMDAFALRQHARGRER